MGRLLLMDAAPHPFGLVDLRCDMEDRLFSVVEMVQYLPVLCPCLEDGETYPKWDRMVSGMR